MTKPKQALSSTRKILQTQASSTALTGVSIAIVMVIFATVLAGYFQYGNISISSAVATQQNNFVLWILDIVPFAFAFWGQRMSSTMSLRADAIVNDRTEQLRQQARVMELQAAHDATHDALTNLPNRIEFANLLKREVTQANARAEKLALVTLSIDQFKEINASLGNAVGDQILQQMADRLLSVAVYPMTVARTGGDEFSLIIPDIDDTSRVIDIVEKLTATLHSLFSIGKFPIAIQVSIGATLYPEHNHEPEVLTLYADLAMRSAKISQDRFAFFEESMARPDTRQLQMVGALRKALQNNLMSLYYQPKVDASSRQLISAEVLARWFHSDLGQIYPDEFVPLAERSGLINELTYWVINESLRQCAQWRGEHGLIISLAVNLSVQTLIDPELPNRVSACLAKHDIPAYHLSFEITETSIMSDAARSLQVLQALIDLGLEISIDDFGTGYSSLSYLKQLPASEIKIDRSFVDNILNDPGDATIVRSTIQLAHNFGLKVVAEGVENEQVAQQLTQWDCDILQGYYLSKPLDPEEFMDWLQRQSA
ncbi:MAG: bifunctional diguanylate cyclase/phosphodiesterase [Porticoccaceae bacterium]|nr:bifunctional diguanylate cyclase/phosphodiesterase [Porticoccaceae bacterium]